MEPERQLWNCFWNDPTREREAVLTDALLRRGDLAGELFALDRALMERPRDPSLLSIRAATEARWVRQQRARPEGWLGDGVWSAFRQPGWHLELRGGAAFGATIGPSRREGSRARVVNRLMSKRIETPLQWLRVDARRSGSVDDCVAAIAAAQGHPLRGLALGRISRAGRPTVFRVAAAVRLIGLLPELETFVLATSAPVPDDPRMNLDAPRVLSSLRLSGPEDTVVQSLLRLARGGILPHRVELRVMGASTMPRHLRWPALREFRPRELAVEGRISAWAVETVLDHATELVRLELAEPSRELLGVISSTKTLRSVQSLRLGGQHAGHRVRASLSARYGSRLHWD